MLVLHRKVNEKVRIGKDIEVQVLRTGKNRVRLGFIGPPEVTIHREEVYQEIQDRANGGRTMFEESITATQGEE